MERMTVLLLFGGESSEHDVSISSARNVYAAIDDMKYTVLLGYIDRTGKWWLVDRLGADVDTHGAPQLVPVPGAGSLVTIPGSKIIKPDVIFPTLYGKNGGDGSIQGLARLLHIPLIGSSLLSGAVCMDRLMTKELLARKNLPVVPYETYEKNDPLPDFNKLSMKLGSPMFIKPSYVDGSAGVGKAYSEEELTEALDRACRYDAKVLIERGISGKRLVVAVLGNSPSYELSDIGEIVKGDASSTRPGALDVRIPADLEEQDQKKILHLVSRTYEALGCRGLASISLFRSDDGAIYINEVNTVPSFTNTSIYPKLWRQKNILYAQLIDTLISSALGVDERLS